MPDPKTILTYSLPSDAVEVSTSSDPDDISRATIQIQVKGTLDQTTKVDRITITIPPSLTARPDNITAESSQFGGWGLFKMGGGVFEARTASSNGGGTVDVTFILRDVEIVTTTGAAIIQIKEFPGGGVKDLPIRKVSAALRIEEFKADSYSVSKTGEVTLSWVTVGASTVRLSGANIPADPDDGLALKVEHSGSFPVTPASSAVYTLTAKAGDAGRTQQVSVTVTDQFKLENGGIDIGNGGVKAGSVDVRSAKNDKAAAVGEVKADKFIGDGAVPKGAILLWSGGFDDVPPGWALCDGSNGTPDLRGKFIAGAKPKSDSQPGERHPFRLTPTEFITTTLNPTVERGVIEGINTTQLNFGAFFEATLEGRRIPVPDGQGGAPLDFLAITTYKLVPYFTLAYIQKL